MKKLVQYAVVMPVLMLLLTGATCANLEKTAYRTIGTTSVLVDGSMNTWGDYVRTGKASPGDEAAVKAAYQKYQRAMQSLRTTVRIAKTAPEGQAALETASQIVSATSAEVIALIETLTQGKL